MGGCAGQTYHVNPVDPEADTVRCRWSTYSESYQLAWTTNLQQFSLDEENCIVTYHPERDLTGQGSRPVAVQVEDFDSAGNLLHSVPLGFVGVVFTPQIDASRGFQKKNPLYSGLLEGTDDHDDLDHDHDGRRRRSTDHFSHALLNPEEITTISRNVRSTEPDHCLGRPSFFGKSPVQGSEQVTVWVLGLKIVIDWEASYSIGGVTFYDVPRYQFSRPTGMTCTPFNSSGKAVCTWFPTVAQAAQGEHPHCAVVYDRYGRASDRQCVTLRVYPPCAEGEERQGSVCVDIDECARGTDTCATTIETCVNNIGSFDCPCSSGYKRGADGVCADVNECADGSHTCAATVETCVNSIGTFDCPCSSGYERDASGNCVDIDECARGTDTCATTIETCVNNVGSFDCPCSSGYERGADGVCGDIDECAVGSHSCAAIVETCVNNVGSFECPCSSGYERVEGVCVDIDECAREIDTCHAEKERCENLAGSYECICLPMSYEDAMSTIREWIDMTTEVLEEAEHGRAYKFDVRMHKLLRNALESYDANCTTPYNVDRIGKNEFAIWEKQATRSSDVCVQATTVKSGLNAWVEIYACMDKKQTHRVSKFIGKVTNPYC